MNDTKVIDVSVTMTAASSYVTGDFVGADGVALVFAPVSTVQSFSGTILSAVLVDAAVQSVACELWLFDSIPTPPADSAAWTVSDADAAHLIGVIPFSTYYASALNSFSFAQGIGLGYRTTNNTLYGCIVTRGSPTYVSGCLTVRLTVWQD
jgi:hypothetical protein